MKIPNRLVIKAKVELPAINFVHPIMIELGQCELEGCYNLFVPSKGGSPQKYCCSLHRVQAYRLDKARRGGEV